MPRRRRSSKVTLEQLLARGTAQVEAKVKTVVPNRGEVVKLTLPGGIRQLWVDRVEPQDLPKVGEGMQGPHAAHAHSLRSELQAGYAFMGSGLGEGIKTLADIDKRYAEGWPEGAAKAKKLADEIGLDLPPAQSTRRRREVGKDGTDPIVEAWLDRDLDHLWERRQRTVTQGHKIIQIAVGWGGTSGYSGEQLFWSGAAALVLTEMLEAAGYGVEVHAYNFSTAHAQGHYDKARLLDITVKPSDQPVSPDQFAAVLCMAGSFRAYGLIHLGHAPWSFGTGSGRTRNVDTVATTLVEAGVIPDIEILLPNLYSREAAINAVREGLRDVVDKYGSALAE